MTRAATLAVGAGERYPGAMFRTPPQPGRRAGHAIVLSGAIGAELLTCVPDPVIHRISVSSQRPRFPPAAPSR
jgi:hypothetical protein